MADLDKYSAAQGTAISAVTFPAHETPEGRAARLLEAGEDPSLVQEVLGSAQETAIAPLAMISGCPNLTYGSRDYDDANCGGAYLSSFPNDAISWYGQYGHNDMMTSLDIENNGAGCIVIRTLDNNVNCYSSAGVWRYYGTLNAGTSLNLPSTQNDRVSSSKSQCS